jgi:hypothetical protein
VWHARGGGGLRPEFWYGNLRAKDYLENLGIDENVILKLTLMKYIGTMRTRLIWLRAEKIDGLF